MKYPQGIAKNKVTDDHKNGCYLSSPCQHSVLKNYSCLELQSTLMKMQKAKPRISFTLTERQFNILHFSKVLELYKVITVLQVDDNLSERQRLNFAGENN